MTPFDSHSALLRRIRRQRKTLDKAWSHLVNMCNLVDQAESRPNHFFRHVLRRHHSSCNDWGDLFWFRDGRRDRKSDLHHQPDAIP